MLDKLYITPKQWTQIFRWALYCLLFLVAMMLQTVILGRYKLFGLQPDLVPVVISCVCLREGPERGGAYALGCSLFWALSGVDQGALLILLLTVLPILASVLLRRIFTHGFVSALVCCALILLLTHSASFLLKLFYESARGSLYFTRLLPTVVVSLLAQPAIYGLVKCIQKIGDPYEAA